MPPTRRLFKKASFPLLVGGILIFNGWLIFFACQTPLPTPQTPLYFYSNQTRQDIKRLFSKALTHASSSIYLSFYGISDLHLIDLIRKRSQEGFPICIEYDASASSNLKQLLPDPITRQPIKTKGLMHRKIAVIDHCQVFLGSANFTATSLKHHANLVIGLYHPPLAAYLENPFLNAFSFTLNTTQGTLFLLPDPSQQSLKKLLYSLSSAKRSIYVAMFTLTHAEIAQELIQAKQRGIDVAIAIDYYTAKGASKKTLELLKKAGIKIYLSQGKELLHHKWALIDNQTLIMGSANWTKAAFSKNQDFLLFLFELEKPHQRFFKTLWNILKTESFCEESIPFKQSH